MWGLGSFLPRLGWEPGSEGGCHPAASAHSGRRCAVGLSYEGWGSGLRVTHHPTPPPCRQVNLTLGQPKPKWGGSSLLGPSGLLLPSPPPGGLPPAAMTPTLALGTRGCQAPSPGTHLCRSVLARASSADQDGLVARGHVAPPEKPGALVLCLDLGLFAGTWSPAGLLAGIHDPVPLAFWFLGASRGFQTCCNPLPLG